MRTIATFLSAVVVAAVCAVPANAASGAQVRTDAGPVSGTVGSTYRTFEGIPFAAPPVGENRWRDPLPVTPWTTPRDATAPGPRCAQAGGLTGPGSTSEDCLYLNVTTPRHGAHLPVMVWIHGGGFVGGAGDLYDARGFAERTGTVVVTVNYRLGAFGYLGFPGLEDSGAFGIADQQAALRWVRRNAHAFGGDPRNVTLFGESAGGYSVCAQLTTPRTTGLFGKAIVQSGPCQFSTPAGAGVSVPRWVARTQVEQAGAALGCPDIACLRALPVDQVIALAPRFATPAYDTPALPVDPVVALREGRFHHVPVLAGTTRDERTLFVVGEFRQPLDAAGYRAALDRSFGAVRAERVAGRYPLDGDADARPELAALMTDRMVACPTWEMKGQLRAFGYEFAERDVPMIFDGLPPFPYGAYHGSELAFLFAGARLTAGQQALSDYLVDAWGRFARTGDPGWRRSSVQSLAIGAVGPVDYAREHGCGFWAEPDLPSGPSR